MIVTKERRGLLKRFPAEVKEKIQSVIISGKAGAIDRHNMKNGNAKIFVLIVWERKTEEKVQIE